MPGTQSVRIYNRIDEVPEQALSHQATFGLFASPAWWRVVEAHAIPPGAQAGYVVVDGRPGLVPVLRTGRRIDGLTAPYTCVYTPTVTADDAMAFARLCRAGGVCRIDAVPEEWDGQEAVLAGARAAGLVPLRFDHFGNWSEDVSAHTWDTYLAARPGALRETVRRRLRNAARVADARFELVTDAGDALRATSVYNDVYGRSWKEPEPFPTFNPALMRAMAAEGALRLGVWSIGDTAVAVQFWVVWQGEAIVLKLAHDESFKAHSPGTVLTALMLRHLLNTEHVRRIDFGRGDDPYKQGWAKERRQRIGFLLANPWHSAGAAALLRHAAGRLRSFVQR